MALRLKDLLREPAPIREESNSLRHCGQQPGRNRSWLGPCQKRAGVGEKRCDGGEGEERGGWLLRAGC